MTVAPTLRHPERKQAQKNNQQTGGQTAGRFHVMGWLKFGHWYSTN